MTAVPVPAGVPGGGINKMQIRGIRSFSPHHARNIEFFYPLTLIVGKNGSGKSAMCHAAQVALGASGRETGRGSHMGGFVRHGQPSAEVRLEIRNAPREERYGHGPLESRPAVSIGMPPKKTKK